MKAETILRQAAELVGGDRERQHGDKRENFGKIAAMWTAWLAVRNGKPGVVESHDVAVMMTLMKLARTQSGAHNDDDYIDAAGYAACAGQIVSDERRDKSWYVSPAARQPGESP